VRTDVGTITQTDFGYTGQRNLDAQGNSFTTGLVNFKARMFDPMLGRFIQPDTLTPGGPQGLNRFSFSNNNPINYNDPTGHMACEDEYGCGPFAPQEAGPTPSNLSDPTPSIPSDPTSPGKSRKAIPQFQCDNLGGVAAAVYGTTCGNLNQAAQILYNPNATIGQKIGSGYYISVVVMSHAGLALGLAGVACGVTQCYLAAVPIITRLATLNPDSVNVSLGNYVEQGAGYIQVGEAYNMTYLQVSQSVYNGLNDLGIWENVNQQFIINQAEQGKTFFITQVGNLGNGTINEMEWIMDNDYMQISSAWSSFTSIFVPNP
jgi:RHS repeat-associated protein